MRTANTSDGVAKLSLLITPNAIRKELGDTYNLLKFCFDPLPRQREKTSRIRSELWKIGPKVCAACGKEEGEDGITRLEVAHLNALEECGKTILENVLPLCRRDKTRKGPDRGCHTLFDEGHISVNEMREVRRRWLNRQIRSVRKKLEDSWHKHAKAPPSMVAKGGDEFQSLITNQQYLRAVKKIEERLNSPCLDGVERSPLRIKLMEACRRRPARGSLERADGLRMELAGEKIPERLRPLFHYEAGYIAKLLGDHERAEKEFEQSKQALNPNDRNFLVQWVPATSNLVEIRVIKLVGQKTQGREWNGLESAIKGAEQVALKSKRVHGLRWVANCKWNLVRLYLAWGKTAAAEDARKIAYEHWESMTVENGWDAAFRTSINAITGMVLVRRAKNSEDAREALRYLSRAIVVMLGKARQQPEGVRDVFFATADALRLLGNSFPSGHANHLQEVAWRVRDGSSWLHPYRRPEEPSAPAAQK